VQLAGWYRKEINSLEDLKGLKIRMPGLGGEVMRKLGAAAVTMAGSEIFPSLQSGAIDATEWVGPWNDMSFGFYQVADYYYWPGWHEPGSCMSAGFNLTVWNSLTNSQKACIAENCYSLAEYNHFNGQALKTLTEKHGVKLREFSPEIMAALKKASAEVLQETADSDPYAKKVFESFSQSLALSKGWTRIGEQAFVQAREDA
jgi:TRAP-type mannitol/chloroaromatic compound transport system substrate-binding protein